MTLVYSGHTTNDLGNTYYHAKDGDKTVVVSVSSEVLDDYGEDRALAMGNDKYVKRLVNANGNVDVREADFTGKK